MNRFLQWLIKWSLRFVLTGLSLLVVMVLLCRLLFSGLPLAQQKITEWASHRLDTDLRFQHVEADWQGGQPKLSLRGFTLKGKEAEFPGFRIGRLDMTLDFRATLLNWTPVFKSLEVNGVELYLQQGDGASWSLRGIEDIAASSVGKPGGYKGRFLDWLNHQQHLDIRDIQVHLQKVNGEANHIEGKYLALIRDGSIKRLSGRLEAGSGFFEVKGEGIQSSRWSTSWSGTMKAQALDLEKVCVLWSGCYDDVSKSETALNLDWAYRRGHWRISGQVSAPRVEYRDVAGNRKALSAQTHLFLQAERGEGWQLWLDDFQVQNQPKPTDLQVNEASQWQSNWYLSGAQGDEYRVTLASEQVDLNRLKHWVLDAGFAPEPIAGLIKTLNPDGYLKNLAVRLYPDRKLWGLDLSADLQTVSVDAWKGAPSAANINGSIRMGLLKGYLDLDTKNFSLGLTKLFRDVWHFDQAKGRLYWDVVDDTYILKSDNLALSAEEGQLKGKLRLDIPLNEQSDDTLDMALTVGMTNGDARYAHKYLPARMPEMADSLVNWLDTSIKGAHIKSGGFLYNGALVGGDKNEDARWGLYFDVDHGHIQYSPEWPDIEALSGRVFINDDQVDILASSARSAGAQLQGVKVQVPLGEDPVLKLNGRMQANGQTAKYFLTKTPIDQALKGEARQWDLSGDLLAGLVLTLPINRMDDYRFRLHTQLNQFHYGLPKANVAVDNINGLLEVSTEKGLVARSLTGDFLAQPTKFSIRTTMKDQKPSTLDINLAGGMSVVALQEWLDLDWLSLLEGEAGYQGLLQVGLSNQDIELQVNSDLEGMEIELPPPLAKPAYEPTALNLTVNLGNQPGVYGELGDIGQVALKLKPDQSLDSAAISFGIEDELPDLQSGKILMTGSLEQLDLEPWQQRFGSQPGTDREQQVANRLELRDLRIKALKYGDCQWSDLMISLNSDKEGVTLWAKGPEMQGSLWLPHQSGVPYRLAMDKLVLPIPNRSGGKEKSEDILASVHPGLLPEADVSIQYLQVGDKPPSTLAFKLRQAENGVRIDDFSHTVSNMTLTGFADWVEVSGEQRSWFQGHLEGSGIDQLQKTLGTPEFISAKESKIALNLNWPGSPLGANFKEMKGSLTMDLNNGRIKQDEANAGALKLFGILNVETLRRRLALDFSDLYKSGIAFDKVSGTLRFDQGEISFKKPVIIEGPNSSFKLDGTADAHAENLDLKLVVTLPVTSNLPVLSVLLGSSPQLAGIIYIADKLVGKKVDQLASIPYRIKGSFDEPEMELEKFPEKAKGRRSSR